ncbi:MAG: LuxR C-terminal-related transcriptional regulator [Candidatus Sulfotelmatobacter sp.]|jgi:DNA-binding NarL/FixJ family response regulator
MDGWLQGKAIRLTPRERDIVGLLLLGCDNTEISKNLNIAPRTVKAHFSRLYLRFGIVDGIKRVKLCNLLVSEAFMRTDHVDKSVDANERKQQVIELVAQGLNNRQMAVVMGTSEHIIKNNLRCIYDTLGLWNRLELALWYEAHRRKELAS